MQQRELGRTHRNVSVIGLGTWQLGADWGSVDESEALAVLDSAYEAGVNFFDTADVYGDGRSEQLIGTWLKNNPDAKVTVATKMGRRVEQLPENYHLDAFRAWNDRSRANLGVDTLDLVQLHCPATPVYSNEATYDALDTMVDEGRMSNYGVSVETVEEALVAIARPNVATVQIIINAFRHKPLETVLPAAREAGVGIIARVPLASGLLTNRYTLQTEFAKDDHRNFNREGSAFDVGETFSGVDYATGIQAAGQFAQLASAEAPDATSAQVALAWLAAQEGISTIIPGARNPEQARANAAAGALEISEGFNASVRDLYDSMLRAQIHPRW
ncbi:aldo/keto reductase [Arthrobacter sp. NIO-1057]|uniref:aldo/keto reductase n=1 Tax=Arthrobacter sp. NIO-1057 TaxID=993071 RepID=UPI00071C515D|nr:aldo/keto reductase [Arthrobacter sp. NIO-1057]KSU65397.1 aldo/keto reductase [Arthrobacter sp. NIO-1057]SCC45609.1 Predicted oxidoreductase [Arthrobacter sp. NIO-1057]